jgi:hypothetical protein
MDDETRWSTGFEDYAELVSNAIIPGQLTATDEQVDQVPDGMAHAVAPDLSRTACGRPAGGLWIEASQRPWPHPPFIGEEVCPECEAVAGRAA